MYLCIAQATPFSGGDGDDGEDEKQKRKREHKLFQFRNCLDFVKTQKSESKNDIL